MTGLAFHTASFMTSRVVSFPSVSGGWDAESGCESAENGCD